MMGAQVGIFGNKQECYGVNPVFSGLTLLNTGRNLKTWWNFEDFIGGADGLNQHGVWASVYAGAGAGVIDITGQNIRPGLIGLITGATAAGVAEIHTSRVNYLGLRFGAGEYTVETDLILEALSSAAEEFVIRFGFGDVPNADFVDGAYFEYDRTVSLNWRLKTADNSVRTIVDSGIPVSIIFTRLKVVVNDNATLVSFYINDVLIGTINTNIPVGAGRNTAHVVHIVKSVGLTSRALYVDWIWLHYNLLVSR